MVKFILVFSLFMGACFASFACGEDISLTSKCSVQSIYEKCPQSEEGHDESHHDSHCPLHCAHQSVYFASALGINFGNLEEDPNTLYSFLYSSPNLESLKRPPLAVLS